MHAAKAACRAADQVAAESLAGNAVDYAWQCGQKLIEAKAQLKHGEWLPWLGKNFRGSARHATRYMQIANQTRVSDLRGGEKPASIRQALKLLAAPDKASHQQITSSESVEWYTPAQYVDAAREVMGGIDIDPATCEAYAHQSKNPDLELDAAEIRMRAKRRIGELSRELEPARGARTELLPEHGKKSKATALKDAGLSTSEAIAASR